VLYGKVVVWYCIAYLRQQLIANCCEFDILKGLTMNQVRGFIISIVIVIITFVVTAIAAGLLADLVGVWKKPVIGSIAAAFVVISGYATAPSHKLLASTVWLIIGAIAAWVLSSTSPYPEDQPTLFPLYATYLSGFIALLLCRLWNKKYHVAKKIYHR